MAHKTITATVTGTRRLNNSVNANPTVEVTTDVGVFRTQADASFGYDALNLRGGETVTLNLTRAGRIESGTIHPGS